MNEIELRREAHEREMSQLLLGLAVLEFLLLAAEPMQAVTWLN